MPDRNPDRENFLTNGRRVVSYQLLESNKKWDREKEQAFWSLDIGLINLAGKARRLI